VPHWAQGPASVRLWLWQRLESKFLGGCPQEHILDFQRGKGPLGGTLPNFFLSLGFRKNLKKLQKIRKIKKKLQKIRKN
jgi:hypothetical protein